MHAQTAGAAVWPVLRSPPSVKDVDGKLQAVPETLFTRRMLWEVGGGELAEALGGSAHVLGGRHGTTVAAGAGSGGTGDIGRFLGRGW